MQKAIILALLVVLFAFTAAQTSAEERAIKQLSRAFGKQFAELARVKYANQLQDEEAPAPQPPVRRKKKSFWKRIGHFAGRMFRQVARNWVQQNTGLQLQDEEAPVEPAPVQPPVRRKKKSFWKRFGHSFGKVFRSVGRQLVQQHTGLQLQDEEAPVEPAPVQPPVRRKKKSFWKRFGHSFGKVFRSIGRQLVQQHTGLQLQDEEAPAPVQPPVRRKKKSFWKRFGHSFGKVFRSVGRQLIQQHTGLELQDEEAPAPQPPVRRKKKSFWKRLGKSFGQVFRQVGRQFIQQHTGISLQDEEVPAVKRANRKIKIVCGGLGRRFAKEIKRAVELQDEEAQPAPEQPAPVEVVAPQARGHCHADGNAYLRLYPDVANANVNPIAHYMNHGYNEGRHFCVKCDGVAFSECGAWNDAGYLQNSPDVAAVYGTAHGRGFAHWKDHGHREPRNIAISGPYQV